jgi:hypothetical protein
LKSSSLLPLVAFLIILSLFALALALPIGYTYTETCPRCGGNGTVTCETCHGSGKCWICGGDGKIDYMPLGSQWCAACKGTGICYTCGGSGHHACAGCGGSGLLVHWMYTSAGSTTVLSIVSVFLFLVGFSLSHIASAIHLSFNEWIYNVDDMGFWFNPSFMTWLFANHRERWARWQTCLNLIFAIYFGVLLFWLFSYENLTQDSFFTGISAAIPITFLFSLVFYKTYTSRLEDTDY